MHHSIIISQYHSITASQYHSIRMVFNIKARTGDTLLKGLTSSTLYPMTIPPIPQAQQLIDIALQAAKKAAENQRGNLTGKTRLEKSKTLEINKIKTIHQRLDSQLLLVNKAFPSLDILPEYKKELLYISLDYKELKQGLGAAAWARKRLGALQREYASKIAKARMLEDINPHRRAYYGRVCSTVNQIKRPLTVLAEARNILNDFPELDLEKPIICIAGFPNVGKSTLLKKITGSNVKIAPYAFTTKTLNVGVYARRMRAIQFVDTPGKLGRDTMNVVELHAHIALKFLATAIIYVFDPTETYSLEQQEKLYVQMKRYRKPMLCYMSKTDIATPEQIANVSRLQQCITASDVLIDVVFKEYALKK